METFEQMLVVRQGMIPCITYFLWIYSLFSFIAEEIGGEIFDLLLSMSDFSEFKEMMVARKQAKEEQKDGDCIQNLTISGSHIN